MSNIVDFRAGSPKLKRSPLPGEVAQILFFTGVRYERLTDDEAPTFIAEPMPLMDAVDAQVDALRSALDLAAH